MKTCPHCNRTYSDESFSFCLDDGSLLSASHDPKATLIMPRKEKHVFESTVQTALDVDSSHIVNIDDPIVAINISQQYSPMITPEDLYNCTRGMWRLNCSRAARAKYFFAVYHGIIKEVFEIKACIPATKETITFWENRLRSQGRLITAKQLEGRSELVGNLAPEVVRTKYVGRQLPRLRTQNPIRYINC